METDPNLALARRLDPAALAKIHDLFYPEVYRYVYFRLGEREACEDISGEVFLRLLDALRRKVGPGRNLRGWLFGTAAHLINDHLRQRYAGPTRALLESDRDPMDGPDELGERAIQIGRLLGALVRLTPDQQHVLALRFAEARSLEETAMIMERSVAAVKTLQFRAVSALRAAMSREQSHED